VSAAEELGGCVGVAPACRGLGVARATLYRRRATRRCPRPQQPRPRPARALNDNERQEVLDVLNEDRFCDLSPLAVWAILLDAGRYLCSIRTMYRILAAAGAVRERRNQLHHPKYQKPELLASAPNQVWSWDITVGFMVADCESSALAKELIEQTCRKYGIERDQLTMHADRGPSMTSKVVAHLYADLGVTKSHSRPYTSNDNPFSESHFRTLKYRPDFPARFGSIEDARAHCRVFFAWYNSEHRHSSLGLMTPDTVHYGRAEAVTATRSIVLDAAYRAHPERFVHRAPTPPALPTETWINPPARETAALALAH